MSDPIKRFTWIRITQQTSTEGEAYLEPCQTSNMELSAKLVNGF